MTITFYIPIILLFFLRCVNRLDDIFFRGHPEVLPKSPLIVFGFAEDSSDFISLRMTKIVLYRLKIYFFKILIYLIIVLIPNNSKVLHIRLIINTLELVNLRIFGLKLLYIRIKFFVNNCKVSDLGNFLSSQNYTKLILLD